jgi:hypothetical protein
MAYAIYLFGAALTCACGLLLLRGYRENGRRLLLWSGICFIGLSLNNVLVFVDLAILMQGADLYALRLSVTSLSMLALCYGLIWEKG